MTTKISEAKRKAQLVNMSASVTFIHGIYILDGRVLPIHSSLVPVLEAAHQHLPCEAFDAMYSIESLKV